MSPAAKATKKSVNPTNPANSQVPQTDISSAETKQNRQFMMIMISVMIAIVLIGVYVSTKLVQSYVHKTDQIKAEDKYITSLEQKQKDLVALQQSYTEITRKQSNNLSTADMIYHALPLNAEFKSLIGLMENIGNESGVKPSITSSSGASTTTAASTASSGSPSTSGSTSSGSTPQNFGFTVSMTSSYDQLINFLKGTERSLRPLNFLSMDLSGSIDKVQSTILFNTYYQGEADISNKQEPLK